MPKKGKGKKQTTKTKIKKEIEIGNEKSQTLKIRIDLSDSLIFLAEIRNNKKNRVCIDNQSAVCFSLEAVHCSQSLKKYSYLLKISIFCHIAIINFKVWQKAVML